MVEDNLTLGNDVKLSPDLRSFLLVAEDSMAFQDFSTGGVDLITVYARGLNLTLDGRFDGSGSDLLFLSQNNILLTASGSLSASHVEMDSENDLELSGDASIAQTGTFEAGNNLTVGGMINGANAELDMEAGIEGSGTFLLQEGGSIIGRSVDVGAVDDVTVGEGPLGEGALVEATSGDVQLESGGMIQVEKGIEVKGIGGDVGLEPGGAIEVRDSAELRAMAENGGQVMQVMELLTEASDISIGEENTARNTVLQADGGELRIQVEGDQFTSGDIDVYASDLSAEQIRVEVTGGNGNLTIGNSALTAEQTLDLFVPADAGSTIQFVSDSTLNANEVSIEGHTVEIDNNVTVDVNGPNDVNADKFVVTENGHLYGLEGNSGTLTFEGTLNSSGDLQVSDQGEFNIDDVDDVTISDDL